ncbi:MAG: leucine-rich repeat domain-containing protein [Chlamydiales bacterium]|nr:leucine-rich repeat domain-containing protein [Chlamydiales bacterium]
MTIVRWSTSARPCDFSGFKDAFGTGVGSMLTVHELGLVARVCTFFRDQVTRRTLAVVSMEIRQASSDLESRVSIGYENAFRGSIYSPLINFFTVRSGKSNLTSSIQIVAGESVELEDFRENWEKYWCDSLRFVGGSQVVAQRHALFITDLKDRLQLNQEAELTSRLPVATQALKDFFTREKLTYSFNQVFSDQAIPENERWQRWAGRDLELARETGRGRFQLVAFLQTDAGRKLNSARFLEVRAIADRNEAQIADSWDNFILALRMQGVQVPYGDYMVQRGWVEAEGNRGALERVAQLIIQGSTDIPRVIERMQGLRSLTFTGAITHLHNEFARLPNLQNLMFYNSSFNEVPALLENLPALTHLQIIANTPPITTLPDGIARKLHTNRLGMLARSAYEQFFHEGGPMMYSNELYLGLRQWDLERVPFYIALAEFSLPYPPYYLLATPLFVLGLLIGDIIRGCFGEVPNFLNAFWNGVLYSVAFITAPLVLLLNLPIFAYNLLLNLAIEPVVTYFRDRLGYSRMVAV